MFPFKCACGRCGHFIVTQHVLLFGFLLANLVFIRAANRAGRRRVTIYPRESDLVENLLRQFEAFLGEDATDAPADLTDMDRMLMNMSEEEWEEFRRRMGEGE